MRRRRTCSPLASWTFDVGPIGEGSQRPEILAQIFDAGFGLFGLVATKTRLMRRLIFCLACFLNNP
jgi:hypothetical protein